MIGKWRGIGSEVRALVWVAFWLGFDAVVRSVFPGHSNAQFHLLNYLAGIAVSWLSARLLIGLLRRIRKSLPRYLLLGLASLVWTSILIGSGYLYSFFGEYITGTGLLFVLSEPPYLLDYLRTFASPLSVGAFLACWALMLFLLMPSWSASRYRKWPSLLAMFAAWLAGCWFLGSGNNALPPDSTALCAVRQAVNMGLSRLHLQARPRKLPAVASAEAPWAKTILVVVNESWGTTGVAFADNTSDGMPLLRRRVEGDGWMTFPHAFTNATSTDVSMSSIFTGTRSDEGWERLHAFPLPWDIAKARGFHTAYVTSQRLSWQNLGKFLFPSGIDEKASLETFGVPASNDCGVDDMISARKTAQIIRSTPRDRPLLLVWNSNSLHGPFQEKSEFVSTDSVKGPGRWFKALRILDVATDTILSALVESGRMDEALVIMTGDHGEIEEVKHRPMRIYNYYDEIVRLPFVVHVPKRWNTERPDAVEALRLNRGRNVQNLDIAPTLAQVLGLRADRRNDSLFRTWKGSPLVAPVDSLRELLVLSANDIHTSNRDGFGLLKGNRRLVVSSLEGTRFFDVTRDSLQTQDLWPNLEPQEKLRWVAMAEASPLTRRIWRSIHALHGQGAEPSAP